MSTYTVVTTGEHPERAEEAARVLRDGWPEFILHDQSSAKYRAPVARYFPGFDVTVLDGTRVVADGRAVALRWDGDPATLPDGYDGALAASVDQAERGVAPDTLCVVATTVLAARTRGGLAGTVLTALRERAGRAGLTRVIAPVRPPLKASYPLTPMARFAAWSRADGLHPDPWIRTHQRLGATVLGPAPRSMRVTGTVEEWERWTGMLFPDSGDYVVPGALDLVTVDRAADLVTHAETDLWMRHV